MVAGAVFPKAIARLVGALAAVERLRVRIPCAPGLSSLSELEFRLTLAIAFLGGSAGKSSVMVAGGSSGGVVWT
jgi:hypothetical protein